MSRSSLSNLLQNQALWRASEGATLGASASDWGALDAQLPGGGFPTGAVTEILCQRPGSGELGLLLPLLARLTQADNRRQAALICPAFPPYGPGLAAAGIDLRRFLIINSFEAADALWSAEQCLASGLFSALMLQGASDTAHIRRLQLAARDADAMVFSFRPLSAARRPSPAALRLQLEPGQTGPTLTILKCRGPAGSQVQLAQDEYGRAASAAATTYPTAPDSQLRPRLSVVS
ncbi:MAG: hypothetical protein CMN28_09710 [Salinisphaeraceae bacterium]|nr:hypothetical protein [Salinisphaeraceae bacterium]